MEAVLQIVSILGALAVLGAFAADQFGLVDPTRLSYALANFIGATILAAIAVVDQQIGFIVLQGAWAAVSLWGIVSILRGSQRNGSDRSRVR